MRISALIVNWNTRDDLRTCLASLLRAMEGEGPGDGSSAQADAPSEPSAVNPQPALLEIIVIDNASTDGSSEMVQREFPGVTLIALGDNIGYAAGNNLAANAASGEFFLFLNPDTVVPQGAPKALADFLEGHPKAGLAAPRLVNPDGSAQASVRGMPTPAALLGAWLRLDRLAPENPVWAGYRLPAFDYRRTQRAPQPMASAWMVRRAAWLDIGPFDEDFPLFFNDVDWCLRAREGGWEVWYNADVAVTHRGGASTSQVKPQATRESHRALVAFYRKHYARRLGPAGMALARGIIMAFGALRVTWYRGMKRNGG